MDLGAEPSSFAGRRPPLGQLATQGSSNKKCSREYEESIAVARTLDHLVSSRSLAYVAH